MAELHKGTTIEFTNGKQCRVISELGRGGQGIVYLVDYDGGQYALKWYTIKCSPAFYSNLESNVKQGAPSPSFLWPLAISRQMLGSFGYIMKLRPKEYEEVGSYMLAKVHFASVDALLEACLQICSAFQKLHIVGLSYQDMNDGNFFINPKTGDVLICDNDNVAPNKINMGIVGKSGYMAPEIVEKEAMPDRYTDYFSLSVILFILIFMNRPFEGARVANCPCLTEDAEKKLFGKGCVFIMDPDNDSNRPVPTIHTNVLRRWPLYPRLLRETFIKAFSREAILNPTKRIMDKTWQQILLQIRSLYAKCPNCGEKTFLNLDSDSSTCIACKSRISRPLQLKAGNYKIPLIPGQLIYRCQAQVLSGNTDLNEEFAKVINNPSTGALGLLNCSGTTWAVYLPTGEIKNIEDKHGMPALPDLRIKFNNDITALITR